MRVRGFILRGPRTVDEILAHAEELADRFESDDFDAEMMSPAEYELASAARDRAAAEARVRSAVAALRGAGAPWVRVGELVGTSGEAARQRYSA